MENDQTQDYSYRELLMQLKKLVHPYRLRFLTGSFVRLLSDMVGLSVSYMLAKVIAVLGSAATTGSLGNFWLFLWLWLGTNVFTNITRQYAKYLCYTVAEKVNVDSQLAAIRHLSLIDIAWHEKENTGNKLKRLQNGGTGWKNILSIWVDNIIQIVIHIIGITCIVSFVDWRVGIILLGYFFTYFIFSVPIGRSASNAAKKVNKHEEELSGLMFETLNNIRTVKVMGMFTKIWPRLEKYGQEVIKAIHRRIMWFRLKGTVQTLWTQFFRGGAIILIAHGVAQGRYDISFLLLFLFYFSMIRESVEELMDVSQEISISRHHLSRLQTIFSEPIRIDDEVGKKEFPVAWKTITLNNVSFSYGGQMVLRNISFDIKRGERIGIVGLSGAGKSTLFKLLLKEYESYSGEIFIDGISLRDIKRSSYFRHVAIVPQETEVFNFSIKDNVTLGSLVEVLHEEKLVQAATIAHMNELVEKLPEGFETLIGEKGIKLSGGEKQRVGIARAVYKEPDILFLDEATSHLDVESEEKIKDSLHRVFQKVTAFVIAHRLSTIEEMDRILLFEHGELRESGTFTGLLRKKGRFFELWEKQKMNVSL